MSSCLGFGRKRQRSGDEEALLPEYEDETLLQARLHEKLHTYQMVRALSSGFLPSTEQAITNLRAFLSADILNPENPDLSDSGQRLAVLTKRGIQQFIELLRSKNDQDQIQDFLWFIRKARISLDVEDISRTASKAKLRADSLAAVESVRTVGSLLLTNSDFRLFLGDLETLGRQVFSDAAFSLSTAAEETGKKLEPSAEETKAVSGPGADEGPAPTQQDFANDVEDVAGVVGNGLRHTGSDALRSLKENLSGDQKETLLNRLKQAILKLRKRSDYSESVSTIGLLIKRYAHAYSRVADSTISAAQNDVHSNDELDRALRNLWKLLQSFGEKEEWDKLQEDIQKVMAHADKDPEFENLMAEAADSIQKMLTDPNFFDTASEKIDEIREKSREVGTESSLRQDIDRLLAQLRRTFSSILNDKDVSKLIQTATRIVSILSPTDQATNPELLQDALHVFIPLFIRLIQCIPIPRLEISVPELDLLVENLILEPGRTINHTSFLPHQLRIETYNDLTIRAARLRTQTTVNSLVTIKLDGLSLRASDLGFWFRKRSGFLRFADEGIASFELDERGLDVHVDVEICKERLEKIISLKAVRVHIHHFTYQLRRSKLAWLAWLFKPILRPLIRKIMERQIATAIADFLHFANRELLYARERLRATRISDPRDLKTFFKAILTRLTPEDDPDFYSYVGVRPSQGVFRGRYAPGSIVKLWQEEGRKAGERIEDFEVEGWRNDIFDLHGTNV